MKIVAESNMPNEKKRYIKISIIKSIKTSSKKIFLFHHKIECRFFKNKIRKFRIHNQIAFAMGF